MESVSNILEAAKAFIRHRDQAKTAVNSTSLRAKIRDLETNPSFENAGLADILKAELPAIEASEKQSFNQDRYKQEVLSRWPRQFEYLERYVIDPSDPVSVEKHAVLDSIEAAGDQLNRLPDQFQFTGEIVRPDDWSRVLNNRRESNNE